MIDLFGEKFKTALLFIALAELLSISGYLLPSFNNAAFLMIVALVACLSLFKLEYGIFAVLAELFIGSKGYLFSFDTGSSAVSLRIALWLVVMAVWSGKTLVSRAKGKKLDIPLSRSVFFRYAALLSVFIVWGAVNGALMGNRPDNIFFDLNGWFYFTLAFPVYSVLYARDGAERGEKFARGVLQIFTAAILWLGAKTFFLLFVFSHNMSAVTYGLYRWVRVTGVGEITQMAGGFYRIFIQSHIFMLAGLFLFLFLFAGQLFSGEKGRERNKRMAAYSVMILVSLSSVLISFSRSFWVGLAVGMMLFFSYSAVRGMSLKKLSALAGSFAVLAVLSVGILAAIAKFPYPDPIGGFDAASLLSDRALEISGEAGASSRWALLPELMKEIRKSPVLGGGFGATVTYKTEDPRILESSPTGEYTTYAFEWGWLDIWLKLGLAGFLSYAALAAAVITTGLKSRKGGDAAMLDAAFAIGLAAVCAVGFFSPYANHPLGIGYLIIAAAIIDNGRPRRS